MNGISPNHGSQMMCLSPGAGSETQSRMDIDLAPFADDIAAGRALVHARARFNAPDVGAQGNLLLNVLSGATLFAGGTPPPDPGPFPKTFRHEFTASTAGTWVEVVSQPLRIPAGSDFLTFELSYDNAKSPNGGCVDLAFEKITLADRVPSATAVGLLGLGSGGLLLAWRSLRRGRRS